MVKHSQLNIIRWRGKLPDVEMPSLAVLNDGAGPWSAWSWNGNASKTFSATTVQWPVVLFLLFRKCRIGTVNEAGTMILVWPNTDRFILEFPGTRWILNNLFLFSATRDGVVNPRYRLLCYGPPGTLALFYEPSCTFCTIWWFWHITTSLFVRSSLYGSDSSSWLGRMTRRRTEWQADQFSGFLGHEMVATYIFRKF